MRRALFLCFPFFVLDISVFASYFTSEGWITGRNGIPALHDFIAIWTAGRHPWSAYDLNVIRPVQAAMTHVVGQFEPYNYPPHFLLVLIPLARLPYEVAFASFTLITAAIYVWSVVAISGRREAAVCAIAMPGFVACLIVGQTGFLAAAIAGFTLLAADKRPVLSGLALASMTFKPQFGPLFPLALALEGRWRVLAVACGASAAALGASYWLFGSAAFAGFFGAVQSDVHYGIGHDTLAKMQSVYGAARLFGTDGSEAWIAQAVAMLGCVYAVIFVYIRCESQNLRNAMLLACAPLFTPHVLLYDLVIVSPSVAFLWREQPLRTVEWGILVAASAATCIFFFAPVPIGAAMPLAALSIALARVRQGYLSPNTNTSAVAAPPCAVVSER